MERYKVKARIDFPNGDWIIDWITVDGSGAVITPDKEKVKGGEIE